MDSRGILSKIACALALSMVAVQATPPLPVWWDASVVASPGVPSSENYAPANLGQLKNMALKAALHLDATLPGGAGTAIWDVVNNFEPRSGLGYTTDQTNQFLAQNYEPINLGQLKNIGVLFYDRIHSFGYDTKTNLVTRGGYGSTWTGYYFFDSGNVAPAATNYVPANLGQLKMVFSFDLTNFTIIQLPTDWSNYYGLVGVPPLTDSDGDGASNADEYAHGTDPTKADNPKVQLNVSVFLN